MTPVSCTMPVALTPALIAAIYQDPKTTVADLDEWHLRLGWLLSVWAVLVENREMPVHPQGPLLEMPTEEWIDAICEPGRNRRWKGDGRQYDRDTVRRVLRELGYAP